MAGVAWPSVAWITRTQYQATQPEQIVRRSPLLPPVSPRQPRWKIVTSIAPWKVPDLRVFLNSLGGAQQVVALPVLIDLGAQGARAAAGDWTVTGVALGGRYLDATVSGRGSVDPAPAGAMMLLGDGTDMRLYEMAGRTGNTWHLNLRRLPASGTNVIRRADTVDVRMAPGATGEWGIRDPALGSQHVGVTVEWIEAWQT